MASFHKFREGPVFFAPNSLPPRGHCHCLPPCQKRSTSTSPPPQSVRQTLVQTFQMSNGRCTTACSSTFQTLRTAFLHLKRASSLKPSSSGFPASASFGLYARGSRLLGRLTLSFRYLRATKWKSTAAAIQRIEATLKWRREYGIYDLVSASHVEPEVSVFTTITSPR
jgi:hypothetical protein